MRLTHFGGTSLPTASEDVDTPIEARSALVELPDGAFDQDGQALVLRSVTVRRSFKITSSLFATVNSLMQTFAKGRLILKALPRDESTYLQTFAKVLKVSRPRRVGDKNYQVVDVAFAQDYPFWMATADEPKYLDNGEELDDGWNLDGNYTSVTIDSLQETTTITNNGIVPIRRGKIIVKPASSASITNLTITNLTNWKILRYEATLAYPDMLVIDLLAKSAKVNTVNAYSDIEIPSDQMDWMQLEVGANSIQIDVEARTGNTTFEWHWSKHYL